jgi:predicted metal-dependent phosphoesterase TrpH
LIIDLHSHSYPKSDDSFIPVDELVDAAKKAGLDGICLTEHDAFWSKNEVNTLSSKHNFLVLPGSEINTDVGHVLVFGLDRYIFGMHKLSFLNTMVQKAGAAAVAAHPYRRRFLEEPGRETGARNEMLEKARRDELFQFCDAVESLNARGTSSENRFSRDLGELLGARTTGGSDAHTVKQVGTAATFFPQPITSLDDLIRELRTGKFNPLDLREDD